MVLLGGNLLVGNLNKLVRDGRLAQEMFVFTKKFEGEESKVNAEMRG